MMQPKWMSALSDDVTKWVNVYSDDAVKVNVEKIPEEISRFYFF
jgi:hypothetical protein